MRIQTLIFVSLIALAGCDKPVPPPSGAQAFELQSSCARSSREFFQAKGYVEGFSKKGGVTTITSYQSHYNAKLNKCFQFITATSSFFDKTLPPAYGDTLSDVLANTLVASCIVFNEKEEAHKLDSCSIGNVLYKTKLEFDAALKPYMEE